MSMILLLFGIFYSFLFVSPLLFDCYTEAFQAASWRQPTALLLSRTNHKCHHKHLHHPFIPALEMKKNSDDSYIISGEEYSRCLSSPKEIRDQVLVKESKYSLVDETPAWIRALTYPIRAVRRRIFPSKSTKPGNLILIKCGESESKANFTFTGWLNPDLTERGIQESEHAARLLMEAGYEPDIVYTSVLRRAIHSVSALVMELDATYLPVYQTWRLNERMYGALQGLNKAETAERFGSAVVQAWRRSLLARPPPAKPGDEDDPSKDRRYMDIPKEEIPYTESLKDCMDRTRPLWEHKILRDLRKGNNVVVVAHSNSIRGLVKIIDDVGDKEIEGIRFPPGIPFVYKFDRDSMKPIPPPKDSPYNQIHTSGEFLEKPGLLKEAMKRQMEWKQSIPGINKDTELLKYIKRASSLEESLLKLKQEKHLAHAADNNNDDDDTDEEEDSDDEFEEDLSRSSSSSSSSSSSMMVNVGQVNVEKDPVVVLVRHGTTPHNQLALFTGWEDPPLADKGVEDAKRAGRLLRKHGFEFDVVYTSWLTRAIQTAWYILDELDMEWLPLIKSWRLNERHYGALTGKSKKMVGNIYGQEQLVKWRRGFDIPPPPTSSYSFSYPGNDYKRTKYVKDIRISVTETVCRSIEARKLQIHRKFPKSESLKQCMKRSIPYYTEKIVPEAVSKGKRVLITSHENAIRGILMHLCEIPQEHMNELHLPNGLPLIYNVRRKCISLLDDGTGRDPLEVYDFGSAAEFLFRPCELTEEDFYVEEEKQEEITDDTKSTEIVAAKVEVDTTGPTETVAAEQVEEDPEPTQTVAQVEDSNEEIIAGETKNEPTNEDKDASVAANVEKDPEPTQTVAKVEESNAEIIREETKHQSANDVKTESTNDVGGVTAEGPSDAGKEIHKEATTGAETTKIETAPELNEPKVEITTKVEESKVKHGHLHHTSKKDQTRVDDATSISHVD